MNTATLTRVTLAATVDALAQVKAEIARLKTREDELKDVLIDSGEASIDGTAHRAALTYCPGREYITMNFSMEGRHIANVDKIMPLLERIEAMDLKPSGRAVVEEMA